MAYLLSGDIGGTKTLLRLARPGEAPLLQTAFASRAYPSLEQMLAEFLHKAGEAPVAAACFALAGPVAGRRVQLTNLPWAVDADVLAARFALPRVMLINDFEAVAHGIAALRPDDLQTLQPGTPQPEGMRLVVGAGTGLGVAWLSCAGQQQRVHPSEGGHVDFAPGSELEEGLLRYLRQRHGHVSYERVVSGPGLLAIYEFLRDSGHGEPSAALQQALAQGEGAAVLSRFAATGNEPIATLALELFVKCYGAFVGNMALTALPRGGIYVAGGIAAKIAARLQQGDFLRAFLDKGRFAGLLAGMPLHVVLEQQVGLLGAERYAVILSRETDT